MVFELLNDPNKKMGRAARTQYDSTTSRQCADIIGALLGDCDMPIQAISRIRPILGKNTGALRSLLVSAPQKGYLNRQEHRWLFTKSMLGLVLHHMLRQHVLVICWGLENLLKELTC